MSRPIPQAFTIRAFVHFPAEPPAFWTNEVHRFTRIPCVGEFIARRHDDGFWRVVVVQHLAIEDSATTQWSDFDAEVYCERVDGMTSDIVEAAKTTK